MKRALSDSTIVITGASSGFGRGTALRLAKEYGCNLVLGARSPNSLAEVARDCEAAGARAVSVTCDVGRADDIERLASTVRSKFGGFDIWINNAGICALGRFEDIPLADHEKLVQTNLLGTLYGSYTAMGHFRKTHRGTLINVASALGKVPAPYYATYDATKFAVVGLSAALRQEIDQSEDKDIHVCTVMPMACDTPFFDHTSNYTGHEVKPVPPLYDPEKVVEAVVELCETPEDEVVVGGAGKFAVAMHGLMPGSLEKIMGAHTHSFTIEKAGPAPPSPGAVHVPSEDHRIQVGRK